MNYLDENEGRGLGIAGLVLGIIGILLSCIPFFGLLFGFIGLLLSVIGLVKANRVYAKKKLIIAGLIVSIFATAIGSTFMVVYYQKFGKDFIDFFENFDDNFYDQNDHYDQINRNFDSLKMDDDDIQNLEKSMKDTNNGPGSAPKN